jgi:simple sugar transport system ATP-binding protein
MVGAAAVPGALSQRATTLGETVASLEHAAVTDDRGVARLRDATIDIRAGEIVGVAGVEGSGQHELLRVIAGRIAASSGTVRLPARIGFVPEDRLRDALVPAMTLVENFALKDAGHLRGSVPWPAYASRAESAISAHDVRASGPGSPAGALSGGNQQKFVLARELEGSPALLVVENPTRGLDIRAAAHVLEALRSARASGVAIVAYSSDIDEVLAIADRMIVCFDGRLAATAADSAAVSRAIVGLA